MGLLREQRPEARTGTAEPGPLPRRNPPFRCIEPGCYRIAVLPGAPCQRHMDEASSDLAAILSGAY